MRNLHLFIAALALVQCVRYGRSAWLFVAPSALGDSDRRDRRRHLIGFVVVLLSVILLLSSLRELLRDGTLQ